MPLIYNFTMANNINNPNMLPEDESEILEDLSADNQSERLHEETESLIRIIEGGKLTIKPAEFVGDPERPLLDANNIGEYSPEQLEEILRHGAMIKVAGLGEIVDLFGKYDDVITSLEIIRDSFKLNLSDNLTLEEAFNLRSQLERMASNGFDGFEPEDNPKITKTESGYTVTGVFD